MLFMAVMSPPTGLVASGKEGEVTGEWGGLRVGAEREEKPLSQEAAVLGNLWPTPRSPAQPHVLPSWVLAHFAYRTTATPGLRPVSPGAPGHLHTSECPSCPIT